MILGDKIASIPANQLVSTMNALLDQARVSIDWSGRRVVSVKGFEGTVEIDTVARRFLQGNSDTTSKNYKALWCRMFKLYQRSDRALEKTWFYKYIVPFFERRIAGCGACAKDPRSQIALGPEKRCYKDWWSNKQVHIAPPRVWLDGKYS